jgi:outer membrane protein TolC
VTLRPLVLALCLGGSGAAAGAVPAGGYPPDLPPAGAALQAIEQAVQVQAARHGITAEEAGRDRLVAGEYETKLGVDGLQRRVRPADSTYNDWHVGVERAFRLPGKAQLDAELGGRRVEVAEATAGDAAHEAARELLAGWFDWVRGGLEVEEWERQVGLLGQELRVVEKRIQAGDAASLERFATDAALAQARAALAQAKGRRQQAADALAARFQTLALPATAPRLAEPRLPAGDPATWRKDILAHDHALRLARAESRRWQAEVARDSAAQLPDPTVGVQYGQEYSGDEQVVGLSLSVPLPGEARRATARATNAQAEAASAREAAAVRRAGAEANAAYQAVAIAVDVWRQSRAAADAMTRNAASVSKAYAAGESGVNEVLTARRLAVEAALAARLAQANAREAALRLELDAHRLWAVDGAAHDEAP